MEDKLFPDRASFRCFLSANADAPGLWLIFGKKGGPKTVSAALALEEALCFGWIDGQMESIDETRYRKYFSPRRPKSKWSDKNKKLAEKLIFDGLMTEHGQKKIDEAKANGSWDTQPRYVPTEEDTCLLIEALKPHPAAYANFLKMTASVRRTYTGFAFDVKSDAAKEKRLSQLVERLEYNLNPMESLAKKKPANKKSRPK